MLGTGDWLSNKWSTKRNPECSGVEVAWEACGRLPIVAFCRTVQREERLLNAYLGSSDRGKNGNVLVHKEDFEFSIVI